MINNVLKKQIIKRDGNKAAFDSNKITQAILKAGTATTEFEQEIANQLTLKVLTILENYSQTLQN